MLGLAVLDACVLYPRLVRDLLLDVVTTCEVYEPLWTAEILEEMRRNVVRDRRVPATDATSLVSALLDHFPEALVEGYESLIPTLTNQEKDRHVLAAAVHARADFVVTDNIKDFPPSSWRAYSLNVMPADDFLCLCLAENDDVDLAVWLVAERYMQRGHVESYDVLLSRVFKSAPKFAARLLERQTYTEKSAPERKQALGW